MPTLQIVFAWLDKMCGFKYFNAYKSWIWKFQTGMIRFVHHCFETDCTKTRSLTQPLLDCILYLTQYLYDPGTLPSSANQCILAKVYLRSNLSRKDVHHIAFHLKLNG